MSGEAFKKAFDLTMVREGGWSFDVTDPGGMTYMGISRVYHHEWPGWPIIVRAKAAGKPLSAVIELPPMVRAFYRQNYWQPLRGDDLAAICDQVATELFDTAVNLGVVRSGKYLQQALNLLNDNQHIYPDILEDGLIGSVTLSNLHLYLDRRPMSNQLKIKMLLNVLNTLQGMHYIKQMRKYPARERFRGWFLRL